MPPAYAEEATEVIFHHVMERADVRRHRNAVHPPRLKTSCWHLLEGIQGALATLAACEGVASVLQEAHIGLRESGYRTGPACNPSSLVAACGN
jgi:hypothetical protein